MKRTTVLITIAALTTVAAYFAFAADQPGGGMTGRGMMGGGMMGGRQGQQQDRMMGGGMMGRCMMENASLASVGDGGVVVLMGNQLFKYDKDLNLVKQAEVKLDWTKWESMMAEHRNRMMQQMNTMMQNQGRQQGSNPPEQSKDSTQ